MSEHTQATHPHARLVEARNAVELVVGNRRKAGELCNAMTGDQIQTLLDGDVAAALAAIQATNDATDKEARDAELADRTDGFKESQDAVAATKLERVAAAAKPEPKAETKTRSRGRRSE